MAFEVSSVEDLPGQNFLAAVQSIVFFYVLFTTSCGFAETPSFNLL